MIFNRDEFFLKANPKKTAPDPIFFKQIRFRIYKKEKKVLSRPDSISMKHALFRRRIRRICARQEYSNLFFL